jgi:hypothetical protein
MKAIFYSNGIDIFGPVNLAEFSKNKYYKSTLIWYEGLKGWVYIAECKELEQFIGTMATPSIDGDLPHALPNATPPLTLQVANTNRGLKRSLLIAVLLLVLLGILSFYNFNLKPANAGNIENSAIVLPKPLDTLPQDTAKQRKLKHDAAIAQQAEIKTYRINWSKFVIPATNEYSANELGGISDLKIILKNNCPYTIDHAQVQVNYLKANGAVYHTERLDFDNLEAKTSKEVFAPNSDRGVKISCSVIIIKSTALNLCCDKMAKDFKKLIGEDPYQCILQ